MLWVCLIVTLGASNSFCESRAKTDTTCLGKKDFFAYFVVIRRSFIEPQLSICQHFTRKIFLWNFMGRYSLLAVLYLYFCKKLHQKCWWTQYTQPHPHTFTSKSENRHLYYALKVYVIKNVPKSCFCLTLYNVIHVALFFWGKA